ncbi:hypothetical protein Y900_027480 [Mycolicibacterium aromaticivorans JS19b1 = JCM 16368]|uniref:Cation efflux protein transmembrane domain-containing protein n=1 Tax=Mycolicibacterium aromaticivorans JS19b1 = JCM 16368 TaxID=1440774 RepID=A0A064C8S3_9MYCO|nr:hypothetical protein Y900_027480 [Mycolicibacterium aromaticivorans JS19b1 = JCM 16368]
MNHRIHAVKISLLALGATSIAQLVIDVISGSVALLADTIHNFSEALTAIPLWIAIALGTKAATRLYTYGYGRAEDLAGLFVIAMITLSAIIAAPARMMTPTICSIVVRAGTPPSSVSYAEAKVGEVDPGPADRERRERVAGQCRADVVLAEQVCEFRRGHAEGDG